jgi:SAM-dependent methyltransferase
MDDPRQQRLQTFVDWARQHITGDEKGEAQVFLDRLLQGFGHAGFKEAGATLEMRVRSRDRKGTAFADLVWKPYVLIEMKKRGEDLTRHYRQAFDYWTHLVPNRPRYVILCNFDEFWVFDFETQMDVPVDTVALPDLPTRYDPLTFLFPNHQPPKFGNHHEKVTRQAADRLATCFNKLMVRHVDRAEAQRFILQMLVAFFAEDIGLLPHSLVARLLDDCRKPEDSYDLLGSLFEAMNTPGGVTGGRFKGVDYFNGGLFAQPARLELLPDEVAQLETAADFNWSMVRPEIFGTIFEHTLESGKEGERNERRAFGAHFTHPTDIMKIVGPTIVRPWSDLIENATTLRQLEHLRDRMQRYTVLDPACGSGNFLYLAYRELKRLEARLLERFGELQKSGKGQRQIGFVTARQFYGIDINPFAIEIAKVTMMIARKLAIDELGIDEHPLPLDNLDANFTAGDALIEPQRANGSLVRVTLFAEFDTDPWISGHAVPTQWPRADVIIGNPPFAGSRYLPKERGYPYTRCVRSVYPAVPKMADYCVYWLRKAHDQLAVCTPEDPVAGRAGLVGTQNIRNNESRVGGLDYIAKTGTIVEAVDNQPWSGEANVHVSIVNWVKRESEPRPQGRGRRAGGAFTDGAPAPETVLDRALLVPAQKRLWYRVAANPATPLFDPEPREANGDEGDGRPKRRDKTFELAVIECPHINSSLSCGTDVAHAVRLACNMSPRQVFQGQNPANEQFMLEPAEARHLLAKNPKLREVIFPYMIGRDLVVEGKPSRYVIDFGSRDMLAAAKYTQAFERIKTLVMPAVLRRAKEERAATGRPSTRWSRMVERWWQFRDQQPGLMAAIAAVSRYIVCSRTTKRPIFAFVSPRVHPDTKLMVFPFADDYTFGVLQSTPHWQWFVTKCSKLTERYNYTPSSVWDTFPWPQSPTKKQINAVAAAGREIRRIRAESLPKLNGGLRALYRTLELPGKNPLKDAHAALDAAVLDAYGFKSEADLLAQLLALNLEVATRLTQGEPVTAPGVPPTYGDPAPLITTDCIQP